MFQSIDFFNFFFFLLQSDNELLVSEMQKKWGSPTSAQIPHFLLVQRESVWKTALISKIWRTYIFKHGLQGLIMS